MTLARLQNVPQDEHDWLSFAFSNSNSHFRINNALRTQFNIINPQTILDPIPQFDFLNWLRRHAQQHSVMDQTLGILQSDLTAVDIKDPKQLQDWIFVQFGEHKQAADKLGIP